MDIIFCERCGVSIPEHQIAGLRRDGVGRDLCATCAGPAADGDLRVYFCENCRVSIPAVDVVTGQAAPAGTGYHCSVCTRCTPSARAARRAAMEASEFDAVTAGDAPAGATAAPRPAVPASDAPRDPIYFCDVCNASIPAAHVATGRAALRDGRAHCEVCRPRAEEAARRSGAGALTYLSAGLLGAGLALAVYVGVERLDTEAARRRESESPAAALAAELSALRSVVERDRLSTATTASVEGAVEALRRELRAAVEDLRAELAAAAEERATLRGLLTGGAGPGEPDRLSRLEARQEAADRDVRTRIEALGRDAEARLVSAMATLREELAGGAAAPPPPPPGSGAPPTPEPGPAAVPLAAGVARNLDLLKDPDAGARFSAAVELGKLGDRAAVPALVEALIGDRDVFVRRACVRAIGDLKGYDAFPRLVEVLTDAEEFVARTVALVLKDWSGDDFGYRQEQSKSDRKRVADRARRWWEDNRARLLGAPPPSAGM